jgi:inorganic triphosphatase YgiF
VSTEAIATPSGREIEIKFSAEPADLARVLASDHFSSSPGVRDQRLRTVYFDTPAGDLARQGIALRLRKCGRRRPVLGLKARLSAADSPFSRAEIEVPAPGGVPDPALFDTATAAALDDIIRQQPLQPLFETVFKRRAVQVTWGQSRIELACDEGYIVAGERRLPLAEVELELKAGSESDLYDFAMKMAEAYSLKLDSVSKAEKGHFLATGSAPAPVKASAIRYDTDTDLDHAIALVMGNALAQFVANLGALRSTGEPEAIHQARVALRRLRGALAMFKRVLPCPAFDEARMAARRIAAALGPVRDYDVVRAAAVEGPLRHPDRPPQAEALLARIEAQRSAALGEARAIIDATDTTLFILKGYALLAQRGWRHGLGDGTSATLAVPASGFAMRTLDRLYRRALKAGRRLAKRTDEERHELRIALKNLRYGVEFFGPLLGGRRRVRRYVKSVAGLQTLLGAHNAVVVARQLLNDLPAGAEQAAGFILGWYARDRACRGTELLQTWARFKSEQPFWR